MQSILNSASARADASKCSEISIVCKAAQLILENGGETYRVEETAMRMAKGLALEDVSVAAFPTSIFVAANGSVRVVRVNKRGTDLTKLDRTNDVSRRVARGEMTAAQAKEALLDIEQEPGMKKTTLVIAFALASACFSMPYGGTLGTFLTALAVGALAQAVQPFFAHMSMGALLGNFAGGLIVSLLAHIAAMFFPGVIANATIAGGIMPLLTGLSMTTAMRDTMYGDLVSGLTRAVEALLLAAFVALGVYSGLVLAGMMGGALL